MAQAQYDFDYAGTTVACTAASGDEEHPESILTFCSLLNGTLTGQTYYSELSKVKRNNNGSEANYSIVKPSGDSTALDSATTGYIAYGLADGSLVAFKSGAVACTLDIGKKVDSTWITANPNCVGFIDVNGATLPNKEVACGTGSTRTSEYSPETPCAVKNDATHMTDIFPVVFHDATVEPATNATKYVLTSSK
jgi:hypothetical protein